MDKAKRFHIYNNMKKPELFKTALNLAKIADWMLEYIDAIPDDVQNLPVMPGFDRDYVENILEGNFPDDNEVNK